jgi:hypothetical protein
MRENSRAAFDPTLESPRRRNLPDSKISKSLAKVFVAYHREQAQISRLTVKILTRERKYRRKAALCANLISAKYLIARQIRHTRLVDKTADQPMIRRSLAS